LPGSSPSFDLILMDVQVPLMDGLTSTARMTVGAKISCAPQQVGDRPPCEEEAARDRREPELAT
jgi:hypothetical protein